MTETVTDWSVPSTGTGSDRRHQPRVSVKHPIEVCGFSTHGRYFTERTFTLDVSDGGCKFRLHNEVDIGSVLAIRLITRRHGQESDTRPVLFQVNWFLRQPNRWTLGVSKLQAGADWCSGVHQDEEFSESAS